MLHLHRSSRADKLVSALGDVLLSPPVDPMAREVVAVPTRGVERWLAQRLSHRLGASPAGGDGVCANVEFPPPAALLAHVTASVCGPPPGAGPAGTGVIIPRVGEGRVADDPWSPRRCVWPLVQLVDEHMGDSFLWPLAQYLRASSPGGPNGRVRRFGTVRRLAELYDRYCLYRPEMVLAWKARKESAYAVSRPEDVAWQAELWRLLREHLGYPSPAERAEMAPALIISDPARLDLPERLSLFGLTRLAPSQLRVLKAVAEDRDVHLFLLHPSDVLWQRVAGHLPQRPVARLPRARDETAALAHNPLVRSWARDSREMQLVLAGDGVTGGEHHALAEQAAAGAYLPSSDQLPAGEHLSTLLELLQADLRADRAPPGAGPGAGADHRPLVRDEDDSVRVHSCHGAARQVEVVREAVLHLLATDATLEPREVIVMCPDIERFAPLVQATFAAAEPAGAPVLRARLADRSLRQTNPMLGVAAQLLDLAGSRVTGAQVLDLATREPVSRRFNFNQDELSRIEAWLAASGARWGLDAAHRAPWHLGTLETGTWRAALDRLLLGVAMSEQGSRLFGGTLPLDDVSGGEIDLAGRLVELVARLGQVLDALGSPLDPHGWAGALIGGTEHLALPPPDQPWQAEELRSAIEEACGAAGGAPVTLDLVEARELLAGTLRGRPTRANFRTGDMTVCTLVPMRSVPHRVVCLLGLDDGLFPRPAEVGSEDLLLAEPQVGDRDVASEDRQLLLDAVLAAG
ncbi:MAG TPA: exodeoxyribonuclease V subunit gamma, partial [Acidimicrobiales bacterium]|nr:exodeoxyribonuclease V subunit gamma [Acidimicrobiales bacterium]